MAVERAGLQAAGRRARRGGGGAAISTSAPIAAAATSHAALARPRRGRRAARPATGTTASSASPAAAKTTRDRLLAPGARQPELALGARELVAQQRAQLGAALARRGRAAGVLERGRERLHAIEPRRAPSPAGRLRRAVAGAGAHRILSAPSCPTGLSTSASRRSATTSLMGAYPQDADDVAALVDGRRDARSSTSCRTSSTTRARATPASTALAEAGIRGAPRRARRLRQPAARADRARRAGRAARGWTRASASTCTAAPGWQRSATVVGGDRRRCARTSSRARRSTILRERKPTANPLAAPARGPASLVGAARAR